MCKAVVHGCAAAKVVLLRLRQKIGSAGVVEMVLGWWCAARAVDVAPL